MIVSQMNKIKKSDAGFTLVEILIAISIFAIGMLAIASMQISGLQGNATANALSGAAAWGADRVETLIALPYDHADLDPGVVKTATEGRYTIEWLVVEGVPLDNVKTIAVTVKWTDRNLAKQLVLNYYKVNI